MISLQFIPPLSILATMSTSGSKNREIELLSQGAFLKSDEGSEEIFTGVCGICLKKKRSSYTDLLWHPHSDHQNFECMLNKKRNSIQSKVNNFIRPKKAQNYFGWLDTIIHTFFSSDTVEKEFVRKNVKHNSIPSDPLPKYLPLLATSIEKKLAHVVPYRFGLIIDRW